MIQKKEKELILKEILSKLKLEKERKELKLKLINLGCKVLWNSLTEEEKLFYQNNIRVIKGIKNKINIYWNTYQHVICDSIIYKYIKGLSTLHRNKYSKNGLVNDIIYSLDWGEFSVIECKDQTTFNKVTVPERVWDNSTRAYKTMMVTDYFIPDIHLVVQEIDDKLKICRHDGYCYYRLENISSKDTSIRIINSKYSEEFINCHLEYTKVCHEIYNLLLVVDDFMSIPSVTKTYIKKEYSRIIMKSIDQITIDDINESWLVKQRLNEEGRRNVIDYLNSSEELKEKIKEARDDLGFYIMECFYSIPEYSPYKNISDRLIDYGKIEINNITCFHLNSVILELDSTYYISNDTGISIDGLESVPELINNSGKNLLYGNTVLGLSINLPNYINFDKSSIYPYTIKRVDDKKKLKEEFLDKLSIDQFINIKEKFINIIRLEYLDSQRIQKYVNKDSSLFLDYTTLRALKEDFPEMYLLYFERNKESILKKYREDTAEGKLLLSTDETQEYIDYIKKNLVFS